MTTSILIILCLIIGALFSRALLAMLRWAIALAILVASVRGLWLLLPELRGVDWSSVVFNGVAVGIVGLFVFRFINNLLVNRDRRADHISIDKKHDARLI